MRLISRVTKKGRATSSNVQRLLTAAAYVSLLYCTAALAQSSAPPRRPAIKSSHNIPKAPVRHRQPTPRDLSATKESDDNGLLGDDADDKALDSKIKSI